MYFANIDGTRQEIIDKMVAHVEPDGPHRLAFFRIDGVDHAVYDNGCYWSTWRVTDGYWEEFFSDDGEWSDEFTERYELACLAAVAP